MRVLVVEDEVRLAATLQDLLELYGYTVDVCHDGEAGLDNALTSIYDVILLENTAAGRAEIAFQRFYAHTSLRRCAVRPQYSCHSPGDIDLLLPAVQQKHIRE